MSVALEEATSITHRLVVQLPTAAATPRAALHARGYSHAADIVRALADDPIVTERIARAIRQGRQEAHDWLVELGDLLSLIPCDALDYDALTERARTLYWAVCSVSENGQRGFDPGSD